MRRVTAGWPMATVMLIGVLVFLTGAAAAFEPMPRVEPEVLGLDPGGLDDFLDELEAVDGARSVVVVHRDRVVAEDYWWGSSISLHHVRSVTKSITMTPAKPSGTANMTMNGSMNERNSSTMTR